MISFPTSGRKPILDSTLDPSIAPAGAADEPAKGVSCRHRRLRGHLRSIGSFAGASAALFIEL